MAWQESPWLHAKGDMGLPLKFAYRSAFAFHAFVCFYPIVSGIWEDYVPVNCILDTIDWVNVFWLIKN